MIRRLAKGSGYFLLNIFFVILFSSVMSNLRNALDPFSLHFLTYQVFIDLFYTFVISIIFTQKHIKSLLSGKIELKIDTILIAILLISVIHVGPVYLFLLNNFMIHFASQGFYDYFRQLIYFIFWYNMIHSATIKHS